MSVTETEARRWRDRAVSAEREGASARALAHAIELRRQGLTTRLDPVRRRHTEVVWSSGAATASREHLERVIARNLWNATEHLLQTRRALERRGDALEAESLRARRLADDLDARCAEQATLGLSFS